MSAKIDFKIIMSAQLTFNQQFGRLKPLADSSKIKHLAAMLSAFLVSTV